VSLGAEQASQSGNFNAEPSLYEALGTDAFKAQAKANVKLAGYGAAVVGADELVKRQLPEDEPGEEQARLRGGIVKRGARVGLERGERSLARWRPRVSLRRGALIPWGASRQLQTKKSGVAEITRRTHVE